jgi:hypothetical protein
MDTANRDQAGGGADQHDRDQQDEPYAAMLTRAAAVDRGASDIPRHMLLGHDLLGQERMAPDSSRL